MAERILLIGSGGREMSLLLALLKSPSLEKIIVAPGSDAMQAYAECVDLSADDADGLVKLAIREAISLVIIGPEGPLALGLADRFAAAGIAVFAPGKAAAQIECSKSWAKAIMAQAGVPTGRYQNLTSVEQGLALLREENYPVVLKKDGLCGGKGVFICEDFNQAETVLRENPPSETSPVLWEEFLQGFEYSLIVLAHGEHFLSLPAAQDYKAVYDGQKGPNTGGMGAVSPVAKVSPELYQASLDQVIRPTLKAMVEAGTPFTGFLYAGLMSTRDGIRVIEFNARMGDPESEVILPRIKGDLVAAIRTILASPKPQAEDPKQLAIQDSCCLGVVLTSPGYPIKVTDYPLLPESFFQAAEKADIQVIHMGTKKVSEGWQAAGGRVVILCHEAPDVSSAQQHIYQFLQEQHGAIAAFHYRTDIGQASL